MTGFEKAAVVFGVTVTAVFGSIVNANSVPPDTVSVWRGATRTIADLTAYTRARASGAEAASSSPCLSCHKLAPLGKQPDNHGVFLASATAAGVSAGSNSCVSCHAARSGSPGVGHPYGAVAPIDGGGDYPASCSQGCHEQRSASPGPGHPYGSSPAQPGAPSAPVASCSQGCHEQRSSAPGPGHPYNTVPADPGTTTPVACYSSCHKQKSGTPPDGHPAEIIAGTETDDD